MRRQLTVLALLAASVAAALGCAPALPRAPALPSAVPPAQLDPPGDSHLGRVQLEVVGDPAKVEIVERRDYPDGERVGVEARLAGGLLTTRGEHARALCDRTPCVADLPLGTYELRYTQGKRQDTAFVTFGSAPSTALHAVGARRPDPSTLGPVAGILGAFALIAVPVGGWLAVSAPPDGSDPASRQIGGAMALALGVAAAAGMLACLASSGEVDHSGPVRQQTVGDAP